MASAARRESSEYCVSLMKSYEFQPTIMKIDYRYTLLMKTLKSVRWVLYGKNKPKEVGRLAGKWSCFDWDGQEDSLGNGIWLVGREPTWSAEGAFSVEHRKCGKTLEWILWTLLRFPSILSPSICQLPKEYTADGGPVWPYLSRKRAFTFKVMVFPNVIKWIKRISGPHKGSNVLLLPSGVLVFQACIQVSLSLSRHIERKPVSMSIPDVRSHLQRLVIHFFYIQKQQQWAKFSFYVVSQPWFSCLHPTSLKTFLIPLGLPT